MRYRYLIYCVRERVFARRPFERALRNYDRKRRARVKTAERLSKRIRFWTYMRSPLLRKLVDNIAWYMPDWYVTHSYRQLLREEI